MKKFGQPWLILTVQYLVRMYINCCYFYLRVRPCKELRICFSSFFFYCPPKKFRPGKAEKNEKASSLYRLRQLTIAKKMKRCVPLRRNVAEKPRGMRLKFVLFQLRTCTHESKNRFVFFRSLKFYCEQESVKSNPVKLNGVSFNLVRPDPTLAVEDLGTR